MEPYKRELSPLYSPHILCSLTVTRTQSMGPLYFGVAARSSSCNWVLTYSVGKVIMISRPPAIPPAAQDTTTYVCMYMKLDYTSLVTADTCVEG